MFLPGRFRNNAALAPATLSYVGPGDLQTFNWWGGLRAYSAAKAAALAPCIDVVDDAVGSTTTTINLTATGDLDVAAITGLGYAVRVSRVYDQTGGTDHANQTTHSKRPSLSVSGGPSGKPTMVFVRANSQELRTTSAVSFAQAFSIISAGQRTGTTTQGQSLLALLGSTGVSFGFGNANNRAALWAGTTFTNVVANDSVYHTIYGLFNGASSSIQVDAGTASTVNPGSNNGAQIGIGVGYAATGFLDGNFLEGGAVSSAMSDSTAVSNNMKTYWGI